MLKKSMAIGAYGPSKVTLLGGFAEKFRTSGNTAKKICS
jgi:hypothetical protein